MQAMPPNTGTWDKLAQIAQKVIPQSSLLAAWELQGGISAQMTALAARLPDGCVQRMVVRRPGARALAHNPHAAAGEFRILQVVHAAGVAAPAPYLLDQSGAIFAEPYLVTEYIEGQPEYAPANAVDCAEQIATQLTQIHRVHGAAFDLSFLPHQTARLDAALQTRPAVLDYTLDEGRIRATLEAGWPVPAHHAPVLLHGDFWPGNLLWREGRLVAVVDWEDAEVGDPLMDLAISRLDLLWILGVEAMHAFTRRYRALAALDFSALPYWDLYAALRPASRLAEWAAGWPELGRPDITEASMRAGHDWFVRQAYAELTARSTRARENISKPATLDGKTNAVL